MLFWGKIPKNYVVRLPQKLNSKTLSLYYIYKYDHCEEPEGASVTIQQQLVKSILPFA